MKSLKRLIISGISFFFSFKLFHINAENCRQQAIGGPQ